MLRYLHTRYGRDKNLARSPDGFKDAGLFIKSSFYQEHPATLCNYIDENIEMPENLENSHLDPKYKNDEITTQKFRQMKLMGDTSGNLESQDNPQLAGDFLETDNRRRLRVLKRKLHQEVYLPNVQVTKAKNKKKKQTIVRKSKKCKLKRSKSNMDASHETSSGSESSTTYSSTSDADSTESTTSTSSTSEESDSSSESTDNSIDSYVSKKRKSSKGYNQNLVSFLDGHDRNRKSCELNMAKIFTGHVEEDVIINQADESDVPLRPPVVGRDCKIQPITDPAQKEANTCNKEVQSECNALVATTESQTCEIFPISSLEHSVHNGMSLETTMKALQKIRSDADEMTYRLQSIMNVSVGESLSRTKSEPPSERPDHGLVPVTRSCDYVGRNNLKFLEEELANIRTFINSTMKDLTRTSWLSLAGNNTSGLEKQSLKVDLEYDGCGNIFIDDVNEMRKVGSSHSEFVQKHIDSDGALINKLRSPISFQDASIYQSEIESADAIAKKIRRPLMMPNNDKSSFQRADVNYKLDQLNNSNFLENLLKYLSCDCNDLNCSLGDLLRRKLVEKAMNKKSEGTENEGFMSGERSIEDNSFLFDKVDSRVKQDHLDITEAPPSSSDKESKMKTFQRTSSVLSREANIRRIENSVKRLMGELRRLKRVGPLDAARVHDDLFDYSNSETTINCDSRTDSDRFVDEVHKPKSKRRWRFWRFNSSRESSGDIETRKTTSSFNALLPSKDVRMSDRRSKDNPGFQAKNDIDEQRKQQSRVIYTNILRAETWTVKQVLAWLESQGLTFCINPFKLAQINGYHMLKLTRQDIKRLNMGLINSIRFMSSLNKLKSEMSHEMKLRCKDVHCKRK